MSAGFDFEYCYRALQARDARFDGWFVTAVTSTGIYCRPSCPARTPKRENVRFYPTAAAAQQAGFRACLRCRPDAAPGSPEWSGRADVTARAMRLIFDGVVDREGVSGLARRVGYSERQLHRLLVAEVGTGAAALARAQRAQTARVLLETTPLPIGRIAFAAGFASIRQFNDTLREVYGRNPTELRRVAARRAPREPAGRPAPAGPVEIHLRLALRRPHATAQLLSFLSARAVPHLEQADAATYRRSLRLAHGPGVVRLVAAGDHILGQFLLTDLRDLTAAIARCRQLCNLDADPEPVDASLRQDAALAPLVAGAPGLRVPGTVDGFELAVRAVIGQQVSLRHAQAIAARLVERHGEVLATPAGGVTHTFPSPEALAAALSSGRDTLGLPAPRRHALAGLASAVARGDVDLDPGADPAVVEAGLLAIPGIGPWTAGYVALRALGDPDAFLATDLGVRRAAASLGLPSRPPDLERRARAWRPWRAYAQMHLWNTHPRSEPEKGAA